MTTAPDYDVIVAGGGTAGVAAAVSAAREGARVLLLERHGCLGGAAAVRNVLTLCGLYTLGDEMTPVVGGIGAEVVAALEDRSAITGPQRFRGVFSSFEPEAMKLVLDQLVAGAGSTPALAVTSARRRATATGSPASPLPIIAATPGSPPAPSSIARAKAIWRIWAGPRPAMAMRMA